MNRIFYYPLPIVSTQVLDLPATAEILSVMNQHNAVVLYALIDDSETEFRNRTIEMYGTGHPIHDDVCRDYLGTVTQENSNLVWHVFERFIRGGSDE